MIKGEIDTHGIISNLFNGLGFGDYESLFEKIDNSIDSGATKINIIITNEISELYDNNISNDIKLNNKFCIISDNGCGMDRDNNKLKSLLNIGEINTNNYSNGKFGIGAIATDVALNKELSDLNKDCFTFYLTKTEKSRHPFQIIINWNNIFNKKMLWEEIRPNDIARENEKYWDKFNIDNIGTININTIHKEIEKSELEYYIHFHYQKIIKQNNITILFDNKITEENFLIDNKTEFIDFYGLKYKNNKYFKFNIYMKDEMFFARLVNSNTDTDILNSVVCPKLHNSIQMSKETLEILNDTDSKNLNEILFQFEFTVINENTGIENEIKNILGKGKKINEYCGIFINRNNKIMSAPIRFEHFRNYNEGAFFRGILSYSNNNNDKYFGIELNKQSHLENKLNKKLWRIISLLGNKIKLYYTKGGTMNHEIFNKSDNKILFLSKENKIEKTRKLSNNKKQNKTNKIIVPKKRKSFKPKQIIKTVVKNNIKCTLLKTPLLDYMIEIDHKDGDRSNNDDSNCNPMSVLGHHFKTTNKSVDKKLIIELINNLLQSELIKDSKIELNEKTIEILT